MVIPLLLVGFLALWAILLALMGIVIIKAGTLGTVMRFGKLTDRVLEPGLRLVIPLVDRVDRFSTLTHQDEFPTEPELITRSDETATPPGTKQPFRIIQTGAHTAVFYVQTNPDDPNSEWKKTTFGELVPKERRDAIENDPVHQPITTEVQFVVEWYLDRGCIRDFVLNAGSEDEIRKRMEDTVARALQEYMGPTTAGHAQEVITYISNLIKVRLEVLVGEIPDPRTGEKTDKPMGIKIRDAYIKSINPGHTINTARSKAAAAVADKRAAIESAEAKAEETRLRAAAEKDEAILRAQGASESDRLRGQGEAARIRSVAEAMRSDDARFVASLEAAREVLNNANTVVVPSDLGAIASILTLGKKVSDEPKK